MDKNVIIKNLFPYFLFVTCMTQVISVYGQEISEKIKVNQIGYLTSENKVAYISDDTPLSLSTWNIKSSIDDATVFSSQDIGTEIYDESSEEFVYQLKFDDFNENGDYYIEVDGIGRSFEFEVSDDAYKNVFRSLVKSFYHQRSGIIHEEKYAGKWARPAEYAEDAFVYDGFDGTSVIKGEQKKVSGGWRDAGDPNKKVVPTSISLAYLMSLYEHFPNRVIDVNTNIPLDPDFSNLGDYLTEIKFGLDWLLTMQREDGAAWHAVAQVDFYLDGLGHLDPNPRYLMPVSTTATADFAVATAMAYRIFKDIDLDYANLCLAAAEKAWKALNNTQIWTNPKYPGRDGTLLYPEENGYSVDPPGINYTAVYTDTDDTAERYWAAGELYISTGKSEYKNYFEANLVTGMWYASSYLNVANRANLSYAMAFKDQNDATTLQIKNAISNMVEMYLNVKDTTGFGVCLFPGDYYWGGLSILGDYAYTFIVAHEVLGNEEYKEAALSFFNFLLGANSLNQTFISGIGDKPVENIFHIPSWLDGVEEVVPGLIPGGPNQYPTEIDPIHANFLAETNPAPAKCYIDSEFAFACNETTIYEGAVWTFVAGYFQDHEEVVISSNNNHGEISTTLYPNPVNNSFILDAPIGTKYSIYASDGTTTNRGIINGSAVDMSKSKSGIYFILIESDGAYEPIKFIKL